MGIEIEKLTERDIRKFKREIEGYQKRKKLFLALGFVFMGLTILLIVVAIVLGILAAYYAKSMEDYWSYLPFIACLDLCVSSASLASTFFVVMVVMFILRGVLFEKKTQNRLSAIEEYELYHKEHDEKQSKQIEVADEVKE